MSDEQPPPKIEYKRYVFGRLKLTTGTNDVNASILNGLITKLQSQRRSGSLPSTIACNCPTKGDVRIPNCDTNDLVNGNANDQINIFKNARVVDDHIEIPINDLKLMPNVNGNSNTDANGTITPPEAITPADSQPRIGLIDGIAIPPPPTLLTNPLATTPTNKTYFGRTITSPAIRPPTRKGEFTPLPIPPLPQRQPDNVMASSRTVLSRPKFTKPILFSRRFSETALQVPSSLKTNFTRPASDMSDC